MPHIARPSEATCPSGRAGRPSLSHSDNLWTMVMSAFEPAG